MDIPAETLEVIKCSSCLVYLSRGPVYLQHDGAAVCGRCYTPSSPANRIKQYEALAKLLKFPCKNRELGCSVTVPYVEQDEEIAHEEVCEHRQYVCPVLGSARCDWLGPRREILQHCETEHPDKVVDNPATLVHDISKASVQTYLLRAFNIIFLLYAKVCVESGKLFHAVRFLGAADDAANYHFTLDIKRNGLLLSKPGSVAPQGCLTIQEPMSLTLDINSLLSVLDGFDGTTFTVAVKQRVLAKCAGCAGEVTVFKYRDESGWRCERCAPARRVCANQDHGCKHSDIDCKCNKHEWYFCRQGTYCYICAASVPRGSLSVHYGSVHQDIRHRAGCTWRATQQRWHLVTGTAAGLVLCYCDLKNSQFALRVRSPLSSERLSEFRCEVRVTDPATGHSRTYNPDAVYDKDHDWQMLVKKAEFPSWNSEFDVCVDIRKAE